MSGEATNHWVRKYPTDTSKPSGPRKWTASDWPTLSPATENPLTARVMVNRIWHHLFGRGIVPTPDDFGPQGQLPSHPELLDWLAHDFATHGWSIKRMIRQIALSRTYGQASVPHPELDPEKIAQTDPQNKWLHRMPVRRLQAEAIRDALLAVSGKLNAQGLRARRAHSPYRFYDRAWISAQRPSRRTWP